jgi:hypothetical protein
MKQNSMVLLIFIIILVGWHNLLLSARLATGKLDLHAGPEEEDQRPLRSAALSNIFVKSRKPTWESPATVSAYISRSVTAPFPVTTPSVPQFYLGRKTTSSTTKQKAIRLQTGGGSRYFIKPHYTEF